MASSHLRRRDAGGCRTARGGGTCRDRSVRGVDSVYVGVVRSAAAGRVVSAVVSGSDGGTTFVGIAYGSSGPGQGIMWQNGIPHLLGYPFVSPQQTDLYGINTAGDAAGTAATGAAYFQNAVLYHNGAYQVLTAPFASRVYLAAYGIDAAGDVVGTAIENDGSDAAVIWPAGQPANPRALPLPAGERVGISQIEDDGYVISSTLMTNSYVWSPDGTRTQIAPVSPGDTVQAEDIRGHLIVGTSVNPDSAVAEWDIAGHLVRTLPGGYDGATWRINANDQVLGQYNAPGGGQPFAVWNQGQLAGLLPLPANASTMGASVITDTGVVAGAYKVVDASGTSRDVPALWTCT